MSFAVFGPGSVYVTRNDIANGTPINIGYANEFSYDEAGETKSLYGQNQYPLDSARGTIKSTGKIKAAQVSATALNAVFHGLTLASGSLLLSQVEAGTIATDTVTVSNSAKFDTDLGVVYIAGANAGQPLIQVASAPTVGQYSVAAGVYTFSAADQTTQTGLGSTPLVGISYAYTATAGQSKTVTNQAIGTSPTFQLDYATVHEGITYYVRFYKCIASKLSSAFKLTDFMMPEVDFEFFANAAGNVYKVTTGIVS